MDDCCLKPPMLRSVVRDRLPDEKRPFRLAELTAVLSHVRTHGLLFERHPDITERKLVEAWRSAVDGWVERVLSLASNSAPDKCWAGICLLGVTSEECCSDRFQSSYTIWFQKLFENFQSPSATHIIKVACCASLADLFTRLACFPYLKKDGTLLARKVIKPVMQILNEDAGETLWDVAANLLCTLMSFFPSSINQHYDTVEAVLTSKIMEAKCDLNTSKKFSLGLAILPKVKGDEESFYLVIQKILIAINSILTDAFQGLEEEKKSSEVMRMIVPPGKDPPPPLGGQTLPGEAFEPATRRLSELLVPRVTALMHSCCIMLTNPYPFPVSIPVRPLLATVRRVLQVDGSFHGTLFPLITSMHQELLCAELPALHLGCLDFLIAIIKGLRSQLLPHGANVVRLLTEYFRSARMPSIRRKVYSIMQMLISMGVGMALYLAQEVVNNVFVDLTDNLELGSSAMLSNMQSSILVGETFRQNYHKKRKLASVIPAEHSNGVDLSFKTCNKKSQAPLSVKIAALKALEALLTMGGSLKSECWRPDVDFLVIIVATNAFDASWANENKLCLLTDESSFADYQLATLEVLLASLLSPTHTRSPYLSQGLDLFRRGRQETGSKIATFCAHALLALEVLIHPRALPLVDHPPPNNLSVGEGFNQSFAGRNFNNNIKINLPSLSKGDLGLLDEEDEELSSGWFDEEGRTLSENRNLNDKYNETTNQLLNVSEDLMEKPLAINSENVLEYETTIVEEKTGESKPRNEISFHNASPNKMDFGQGSSAVFAADMTLQKSESLVNISVNTSNQGSNAPGLSKGKIKEDSSPRRTPNLDKGKDAMLSYDSDSISLGSLPDIVDGDPDSE
ncbi:proline-, glutamic acid- and leucine-rich protein 1-like [Dendrobium catenatum]|nr:proline-, glutamic acid- and leucine-rich protein 1-like [Dendrobium catenatum]